MLCCPPHTLHQVLFCCDFPHSPSNDFGAIVCVWVLTLRIVVSLYVYTQIRNRRHHDRHRHRNHNRKKKEKEKEPLSWSTTRGNLWPRRSFIILFFFSLCLKSTRQPRRLIILYSSFPLLSLPFVCTATRERLHCSTCWLLKSICVDLESTRGGFRPLAKLPLVIKWTSPIFFFYFSHTKHTIHTIHCVLWVNRFFFLSILSLFLLFKHDTIHLSPSLT